MNIIEKINAEQLRTGFPEFGPGDTIRVHQRIQESGKERIQIFEGVVISRAGGGIGETFTVRKISYNVGVERIFPIHAPIVQKIEVKQRGKVRRSKLYYLKNLQGKAARIEERRYTGEEAAAATAPAVEAESQA